MYHFTAFDKIVCHFSDQDSRVVPSEVLYAVQEGVFRDESALLVARIADAANDPEKVESYERLLRVDFDCCTLEESSVREARGDRWGESQHFLQWIEQIFECIGLAFIEALEHCGAEDRVMTEEMFLNLCSFFLQPDEDCVQCCDRPVLVCE
jgi:hypothetical protein